MELYVVATVTCSQDTCPVCQEFSQPLGMHSDAEFRRLAYDTFRNAGWDIVSSGPSLKVFCPTHAKQHKE